MKLLKYIYIVFWAIIAYLLGIIIVNPILALVRPHATIPGITGIIVGEAVGLFAIGGWRELNEKH